MFHGDRDLIVKSLLTHGCMVNNWINIIRKNCLLIIRKIRTILDEFYNFYKSKLQ